MGFLEPSLARELALKKRFSAHSFSDDEDFVNQTKTTSHKGKGVGKGKSKRAPTPPPAAASSFTAAPQTTSASSSSAAAAAAAAAQPAAAAAAAPAAAAAAPAASTNGSFPLQHDTSISPDNLPVNANSQITAADRGAIVCESRIDELSEKLKRRGLTVKEEHAIMEEIALQTSQLEVNLFFLYFVFCLIKSIFFPYIGTHEAEKNRGRNP